MVQIKLSLVATVDYFVFVLRLHRAFSKIQMREGILIVQLRLIRKRIVAAICLHIGPTALQACTECAGKNCGSVNVEVECQKLKWGTTLPLK